MSSKQPGMMQGVELHAAELQGVSLPYPYQNQYSDIDNIPIFLHTEPTGGCDADGVGSKWWCQCWHNCSVSRYNFPLCIITGLAAQGAATIHNTETAEKGRGMHSYTYTLHSPDISTKGGSR